MVLLLFFLGGIDLDNEVYQTSYYKQIVTKAMIALSYSSSFLPTIFLSKVHGNIEK